MATITKYHKNGSIVFSVSAASIFTGPMEYIGGGMFIIVNNGTGIELYRHTGKIFAFVKRISASGLPGFLRFVGVTYDRKNFMFSVLIASIPTHQWRFHIRDINNKLKLSVNFGANQFFTDCTYDKKYVYFIKATGLIFSVVKYHLKFDSRKTMAQVSSFNLANNTTKGITFERKSRGKYIWTVDTSPAVRQYLISGSTGTEVNSFSCVANAAGITNDGKYIYVNS